MHRRYAAFGREESSVKTWKLCLLSLVPGVLGWLLLSRIFGQSLNGVVLAVVAGIMTYIALDELLPSAEKFGHHHLSIIGVIAGMAVMAASMILI